MQIIYSFFLIYIIFAPEDNSKLPPSIDNSKCSNLSLASTEYSDISLEYSDTPPDFLNLKLDLLLEDTKIKIQEAKEELEILKSIQINLKLTANQAAIVIINQAKLKTDRLKEIVKNTQKATTEAENLRELRGGLLEATLKALEEILETLKRETSEMQLITNQVTILIVKIELELTKARRNSRDTACLLSSCLVSSHHGVQNSHRTCPLNPCIVS